MKTSTKLLLARHRSIKSKFLVRGLRILVTEPEYFTPASVRAMRKIGTVRAERLSRKKLLEAVRDVDVLVVRIETKVDASLIARAKNLKCVVSATTGLNHIDTALLKKRGIPLFSLSGAHSVPTAEHTLALLFAAARRIPWAHAHMERGQWRRWEFLGVELAGKTLGIVGIGRIGTEVAKRARILGLEVIAYDPYVHAREVKARGARKVGWLEFLRKSDFISLHAPLTRETRDMFSRSAFAKMKKSAILINTARGAIVNEKALLAALSQKRIRSAALDVYPEEPLVSSSPLRRYARAHENLILTPHIAASTHEAIERASAYSVEVIAKYFDI